MDNKTQTSAKALEIAALILGHSSRIKTEFEFGRIITDDFIKDYLALALLLETHIQKES
jgi:hypothetical protein